MDPMSIVKNRYSNRSFGVTPSGEAESRLNDVVRQTKGKKTKGTWGQDLYPVDVSNYSEFIGVLTTLGWIMRDLNYEVRYLTQSGMTYNDQEMPLHSHLYNESGTRIVALVAVGNTATYRFTRDSKGLRLRKFDDHAQAIAPMRDGNITGTKRIDPATMREITRFAKRQTDFDLTDDKDVRAYGKHVRLSANKPRIAQTAKTRLRMEFRKH